VQNEDCDGRLRSGADQQQQVVQHQNQNLLRIAETSDCNNLRPDHGTVRRTAMQNLHQVHPAVAGRSGSDCHIDNVECPFRSGVAAHQHRVHCVGGGGGLPLRIRPRHDPDGDRGQFRHPGRPQHTQVARPPQVHLQVHPERDGPGDNGADIGAPLLQDSVLLEADAHTVRTAEHDICSKCRRRVTVLSLTFTGAPYITKINRTRRRSVLVLFAGSKRAPQVFQ
jgi:hypothetical protein